MQSPFKDRLLLTAFLVILLAFGLLVARKYFISTPSPPPVATVPPEEPRQRREVVLYFGNPDGTHLVSESREVSDCLVESDCVRETVQALINGPLGNSIPIIPSHSVLRGVALENGAAILDFSRDLVTGHPGGSISELLTVYGLANTVAVNFPHLRQVRILIEGASVETLKGHLGLQEPVTADFRYTRPPEGVDGDSPAPLPAAKEERSL